VHNTLYATGETTDVPIADRAGARVESARIQAFTGGARVCATTAQGSGNE